MPEQNDPQKILQSLADRLPDTILLDLFPKLSPRDIRKILSTAAGQNSRQTDQTAVPAKNHSLPDQKHLPFNAENTYIFSLYSDGASRGNPGDAGAGIILLDRQGNELSTRSLYLGKCTNNSAEYQALIAGLEVALEVGCRDLHIFLDSQLIVRQIQGIYKVKNEDLKPLYNRARRLLTELQSWKIYHIPREKNFRADHLANKGIDDSYVSSRQE